MNSQYIIFYLMLTKAYLNIKQNRICHTRYRFINYNNQHHNGYDSKYYRIWNIHCQRTLIIITLIYILSTGMSEIYPVSQEVLQMFKRTVTPIPSLHSPHNIPGSKTKKYNYVHECTN